jgi:lipoyl(octanoyl) transferase
MDYAKFLDMQTKLVSAKLPFTRSPRGELVQNENAVLDDYVIVGTHNPVYTVGRRVAEADFDDLVKKGTGAGVFKTGRGGQWTWHGPGQLVLYPILDLQMHTKSLKSYVCHLEATLIEACKALGVEAERGEAMGEIGIWVKGTNRKIGFVGVQNNRWVTSHGVSLNVCNDLRWFDHIVPCGIPDLRVTSVKAEAALMGDRDLLAAAQRALLGAFRSVFNVDYIDDHSLRL